MDEIKNASELFFIRSANLADAAEIARLCLQLGYQASTDDIEGRLEDIFQDKGHAVFVADSKEGGLFGWIHVYEVHLIETPPYAEIGGLVVDKKIRRMGAGQKLIAAAEEWTIQSGLDMIRLRSNVVRPEAHYFYPAIGYEHTKTQKTYQKALKRDG